MRLNMSRQTLVPFVVACAMFMQNLDSTVIATALPTIAPLKTRRAPNRSAVQPLIGMKTARLSK